jgi:hypothetical protein
MPGPADVCAVCQQKVASSLPRCVMCQRAFCSSCAIRVGTTNFCSRLCGQSFFYGGESDVEDREKGEPPEDE